MPTRHIDRFVYLCLAVLIGMGLTVRIAWTDGAPTSQPATRPTAGDALNAELQALRDEIAKRPVTQPAPPPSRPPPYVDPRDFGAQGDGVNDDGPAIQKAIDSFVAMNAKGVPNSGKVFHQTYANGGTVLLAPGTYTVGKPIKLWGMIELAGSGPNTVVDATRVDGDGAIDLATVDLSGNGDFVHTGSVTRDLAINVVRHLAPVDAKKPDGPKALVGGHAIFSSTGGGFIRYRIEHIQVCSEGSGVYLPDGPGGGCYSQDAYIDHVDQFNPGSGGLLIRGNQNYVTHYLVQDGTGGPRLTGYRSPWETSQLAMIDVGGTNNYVGWCHVEFNVGQDKAGKPNAMVACYAFRGNGGLAGFCTVEGDWPEIWPVGATYNLGFTYLLDHCTVRGDMLEAVGGVVKAINGGKRGGQ